MYVCSYDFKLVVTGVVGQKISYSFSLFFVVLMILFFVQFFSQIKTCFCQPKLKCVTNVKPLDKCVLHAVCRTILTL